MSVAQDVIAVKVPTIESRFNDCIIIVAEITINYWMRRPLKASIIRSIRKELIKLKTNKLQALDGKKNQQISTQLILGAFHFPFKGGYG